LGDTALPRGREAVVRDGWLQVSRESSSRRNVNGMHKLLRRAIAVVFATFVLAACGGGSATTSGSSGAASDVTIGASNLAFTASSYTAKAGDITIALDNQDVVEHNVTMTQGNKLLVEAGPKKKVTKPVTLAAGTYDFYCTIPGHNMKATLTVS